MVALGGADLGLRAVPSSGHGGREGGGENSAEGRGLGNQARHSHITMSSTKICHLLSSYWD